MWSSASAKAGHAGHKGGQSLRRGRAVAAIAPAPNTFEPAYNDGVSRKSSYFSSSTIAETGERIRSGDEATTSFKVAQQPRPRVSPSSPCWDLSEGWHVLPHHKTKAALWKALKSEADKHAEDEPVLASHLHSSVLMHDRIELSLAFILANKLSSSTLLPTNLMQTILNAYAVEPDLVEAAVADMQAVYDRDPACVGYMQIMLFFKGFQAIQSYRVAHWLWTNNRQALALALQSRISQQFGVDIHPAAYIGRGVMMDHATGIVIGETAVIGDNVSMLHHVTIGGSGVRTGIRHPTIGHGVLLGAGVTVLGPIHLGYGSKIGAGSVVVHDIPEKCVAVGVPARVIKQDKKLEPCQDMDQAGDFVLDFTI